jgi:Uma2 family endonuclease
MAEPLIVPQEEPDLDEPSGVILLQRWIDRPDGSLELWETPLTAELFLDPQLEDKMVQGQRHHEAIFQLLELLHGHFRERHDILILSDVKHLLGPGLPGPAPDISVIQGIRVRDMDRPSFNVAEEGVVPSLVIEIVSPIDARIRRTDMVDKVALYESVGIPEYFLADIPRPATKYRYQLMGYRLNRMGRYQRIEPDSKGRILSERTGLRFSVSSQGDRILVFEDVTGKRLLSSFEQTQLAAEAQRGAEDRARLAVETQRVAEDRTRLEIEARKAAEADLAQLREELERLKRGEP